jgi:hypothetical protein
MARLLPGETAFLGHVFALPAAGGEAGLPVLAAFRETSGRAALGLGAGALAGLQPLRTAFASANALSAKLCATAATSAAHISEAFAFPPPCRLNTVTNAKHLCAYLRIEAGG